MPSTTPIPAPPASPPLIGLLTSITPSKEGARWENPDAVVTYTPEGCNDGTSFNRCDPPATIPAPNKPSIVEWMPYGLSVAETCSAFSTEVDDEEEARVRRLMNADTERQLGAEFWDGNLAKTELMPDGSPWPNDWLANGTADVLTETGPVTLSHGMACLDQYLASNNSGQQGAIHSTVQTLNQWVTLRVAEFINGKWYSPGGNLIISSPGYSGTDINGGIADNNIWAYATDMPRIFLGAIQTFPFLQSFDRDHNTMVVQAQRSGLVEWQLCRHAGVQLAMDTCDSGGS